jgi:hypothetical protein
MRCTWACSLTAVAVLLAGCGSGGSKSNGVASMTPTQILAEVQKATASASSVHVAGSGTSGGTPIALDLKLVTEKGGAGHIEIDGLGFDIIRVGPKMYFKGEKGFLAHYAGAQAAQLLAGRWFYVPSNSSGFSKFTPLTNLNQLMNQILTSHGTIEKGDETKVDGQPAIPLTDTTQGGTLYVATTGPAYPLELAPGNGKGGSITFTEWDEPMTLTRPARSIDYARLTGG